jgi:hypothetical protein
MFDRRCRILSGREGSVGHHLVIDPADIRNEIRTIVLASVRRFIYGLISASRGRTTMEMSHMDNNAMKITFDTPGNASLACRGTEGAVSIVAFAGRLAG